MRVQFGSVYHLTHVTVKGPGGSVLLENQPLSGETLPAWLASGKPPSSAALDDYTREFVTGPFSLARRAYLYVAKGLAEFIAARQHDSRSMDNSRDRSGQFETAGRMYLA